RSRSHSHRRPRRRFPRGAQSLSRGAPGLATRVVADLQLKPVPLWGRMSLYIVVLLVSIALAVSLALGATPTLAQSAAPSQLPATRPGLTRDEGVFLITAADDGSRAAYFIAQNTRHSIAAGDLQLEQQLNPLWPVRAASRDEVLAFAEAAPIGKAKMGLITAPVEPAQEDASPAVDEPSPVAEAPSTAAEEVPVSVVAERT